MRNKPHVVDAIETSRVTLSHVLSKRWACTQQSHQCLLCQAPFSDIITKQNRKGIVEQITLG